MQERIQAYKSSKKKHTRTHGHKKTVLAFEILLFHFYSFIFILKILLLKSLKNNFDLHIHTNTLTTNIHYLTL